MKNKLTTIIMVVIMLLIIGVLGCLGYVVWQNIKTLDVASEPEMFQTEISSENTVDTESLKTPSIIENNNPFAELSESNNQSIDYSQVSVDKYFYNQLEEPSKTIYKAFESNKEQMKSGNFKVEFGNAFKDVLDSANGQEKLGAYYQSAIEAYTYDNPDVFYLSPNKIYLNIETTQTSSGSSYNVYINCGNESNYFIDEFSNESEVNNALTQVENIRNQLVAQKTGSTYNDIKLVHDYIINNTEYDTTISRPNIYNMYGALVNKSAVCEGYARAFKYIMDGMNIPCVLVIGQGTNSNGETENHAWNYVQVNGNWYAIDCTWDDPVVEGGGTASQASKYKYFLKGSSTFSQDHTANGQFTPGGKLFTYPTLST